MTVIDNIGEEYTAGLRMALALLRQCIAELERVGYEWELGELSDNAETIRETIERNERWAREKR